MVRDHIFPSKPTLAIGCSIYSFDALGFPRVLQELRHVTLCIRKRNIPVSAPEWLQRGIEYARTKDSKVCHYPPPTRADDSIELIGHVLVHLLERVDPNIGIQSYDPVVLFENSSGLCVDHGLDRSELFDGFGSFFGSGHRGWRVVHRVGKNGFYDGPVRRRCENENICALQRSMAIHR